MKLLYILVILNLIFFKNIYSTYVKVEYFQNFDSSCTEPTTTQYLVANVCDINGNNVYSCDVSTNKITQVSYNNVGSGCQGDYVTSQLISNKCSEANGLNYLIYSCVEDYELGSNTFVTYSLANNTCSSVTSGNWKNNIIQIDSTPLGQCVYQDFGSTEISDCTDNSYTKNFYLPDDSCDVNPVSTNVIDFPTCKNSYPQVLYCNN